MCPHLYSLKFIELKFLCILFAWIFISTSLIHVWIIANAFQLTSFVQLNHYTKHLTYGTKVFGGIFFWCAVLLRRFYYSFLIILHSTNQQNNVLLDLGSSPIPSNRMLYNRNERKEQRRTSPIAKIARFQMHRTNGLYSHKEDGSFHDFHIQHFLYLANYWHFFDTISSIYNTTFSEHSIFSIYLCLIYT